MAKFCKKCGRMAQDTDMVCTQCGTPLEPVQKDAADRLFRKIGIVFGAVIVLTILVNIISANTGYRATVRKMVKYFANEKTEKLVKLSSTLEQELYEAYGSDDYEDYCEEKISSRIESIEDEVGNIKKITYKISYAEKVDDDLMEEIEDEIDDLDVKISIKKAYTVGLTLTVKGSKDTKDYYTTVIVMKENGKWKIASQSY